MKLNKPTSLTQGEETLSGTLTAFTKDEQGAYLTLFVPKKKPVDALTAEANALVAQQLAAESAVFDPPPLSMPEGAVEVPTPEGETGRRWEKPADPGDGQPAATPTGPIEFGDYGTYPGERDEDEEEPGTTVHEMVAEAIADGDLVVGTSIADLTLDDDDDESPAFELDLSAHPVDGAEPEQTLSEEVLENAQHLSMGVTPYERLQEVIAPYSDESLDKAHALVTQGKVQLAKHEGQVYWYNVIGSTLYVTKITVGEDFVLAECSCPNGEHRGGNPICYHSIAARVIALGLDGEWANTP